MVAAFDTAFKLAFYNPYFIKSLTIEHSEAYFTLVALDPIFYNSL